MGAAHQWRLFRPLVRMIGRSLLFIIAVLVLWLLPPAPFRPPLVFVVVVAMGLVVPFIIGLRDFLYAAYEVTNQSDNIVRLRAIAKRSDIRFDDIIGIRGGMSTLTVIHRASTIDVFGDAIGLDELRMKLLMRPNVEVSDEAVVFTHYAASRTLLGLLVSGVVLATFALISASVSFLRFASNERVPLADIFPSWFTLVPLAAILLLVLAWYRSLTVGYQIKVRNDNALEFRSLLRSIVLQSQDILAITREPLNPGLVRVRHRRGTLRIFGGIPSLDELIKWIGVSNKGILLRNV